MHTILKAGLALAAILPLAACNQEAPKKPCIAVVDVTKAMTESTPGKAGAERIQKVHDILQKNMKEVEEAVKDQPEQQRASSTLQGQRILQDQLNRERAETTRIVGGFLTDCVKEWRQSPAGSDVAAVIAKHNLLDSQASIDVTDAILVCMNKKEAKFGDLPNITVKKGDPADAKKAPATAPEAKPAADKAPDAKAAPKGKK